MYLIFYNIFLHQFLHYFYLYNLLQVLKKLDHTNLLQDNKHIQHVISRDKEGHYQKGA